MEHFVTHEELQKAFGCKRKSALEKALRLNKINYFYSERGKLSTTPEELNRALSGKVASDVDDAAIEFKRRKPII